ncbi:MAG: DUF1902 domain-containing protein [Pseudomonadota bacterium]
MVKRNFEVEAIWDEEASVWISESDIEGLHVQADTLSEFHEVVREFAAELIVANHYADESFDEADLASQIPAIFLKTGAGPAQPC